jgi:hypothetical protein
MNEITEKELFEISDKINLIDLIDNLLEEKISKEKDPEKLALLEKVYSEGWGDVGDWFGNMRNNMKTWKNQFNVAYNRQMENPNNDHKRRVALQAYQMLKKSNIATPEVRKAIDNIIKSVKKPAPSAEAPTPPAAPAAPPAAEPSVPPATESTSSGFKTWLFESEARYLRLRPELQQPEVRKYEVAEGDIVEMGPETEFKGSKINRISQVVEIRANEIVVRDLTRTDSKKIVIPTSELYDKEELRGARIIPREEAELKALGGQRLWVRLSPRQHKKYASSYRVSQMPEIIPMDKGSEPSKALRRMFSPSATEQKPEVLDMFQKNKRAPGENPLKKFVASKKGIFGL